MDSLRRELNLVNVELLVLRNAQLLLVHFAALQNLKGLLLVLPVRRPLLALHLLLHSIQLFVALVNLSLQDFCTTSELNYELKIGKIILFRMSHQV